MCLYCQNYGWRGCLHFDSFPYSLCHRTIRYLQRQKTGPLLLLIFDLIALGVGATWAVLIDQIWFKIDYKKAEKGLEVLDHYHHGIALLIIASVFNHFVPSSFSLFVLGFGLVFIIAEAKQGNPFAYGSSHFRATSAIGIILCITLIIVLFITV